MNRKVPLNKGHPEALQRDNEAMKQATINNCLSVIINDVMVGCTAM